MGRRSFTTEFKHEAGTQGDAGRAARGAIAQQGLYGEVQHARKIGQEVGRRVIALGLVVGDTAVGGAQFGGQPLLGVAGALAKAGEALAEGAALGVCVLGHGPTRWGCRLRIIYPVLVHGSLVRFRAISGFQQRHIGSHIVAFYNVRAGQQRPFQIMINDVIIHKRAAAEPMHRVV